MKWIMPEIEGKSRSEVGPCAVNLEANEKMEDVCLSIAKSAIRTVKPAGLGAPIALFSMLSGQDLISETDESSLLAQIKDRNGLNIDYWKGRPVKLSLRIASSTVIQINVNMWTDRLPGNAPWNIPREVIQDLQNVLEIACGTKEPDLYTKNDWDHLSYEDLRDRVASEVNLVTRKQGRFWSTHGSLDIPVPKEEFFRCSMQDNLLITPELQKEILAEEELMCDGCFRTLNARTNQRRFPECIGCFLLVAWRAKHR